MRLFNRLLAALLAVALIVVGVLLIIEVIADRTTHDPAIVHWHSAYEWAGRTIWQAASVRVACIVLLAVGIVLLVAELKRPRVSRLSIATNSEGDADPIDAAYTRRGVANTVRSAVTDVDGIRAAKVKVRRHSVRVQADASAQDKAAALALKAPATSAAESRLTALRLKKSPSLAMHVRPRSR